MNKKYLLLSLLLIALISLLTIYLYRTKTNDKMVIQINEKEKVTVNDIIKINETNKDSTIEFKKEKLFSFDYFPKNQLFIITILDQNVSSVRVLAEKSFLDTMGISKEDACKLNVQVGVPFSFNKDLAGINFGLSFCPGGKSLQ